jgi:phospholipid/cholesterol/gamma-HCH transport system permease protein
MAVSFPGFQAVLYRLGFFVRTLACVPLFVKSRSVSSRVLVMQIYFTFVQALGLCAMLALGTGAALSVIAFPFLQLLSSQQLLYPLLIAVVTRELGPLLTAFIVIARSATAIATETAGMVINHEVEAYVSVGVDPVEHLAVPRLLGVTVSLLLLNIYFSVFALAGSFAVVGFFHAVQADVFFGGLIRSLTVADLATAAFKSVAFGIVISVTAIGEGLAVERSSTEVPVAGLRAVTRSFAICIAFNIILSAMHYTVLA